MEWTTIITALIAALIPSGLIGLLTIREQRKNAKLENEAKEIDNKDKEDNRWERLADQLEEQNLKMQEQLLVMSERLEKKDYVIQDKEDHISDIREKLDSVRTKCALATIMRCESMSCPNRVPPVSMALTKGLGDALQDYVEDLAEKP